MSVHSPAFLRQAWWVVILFQTNGFYPPYNCLQEINDATEEQRKITERCLPQWRILCCDVTFLWTSFVLQFFLSFVFRCVHFLIHKKEKKSQELKWKEKNKANFVFNTPAAVSRCVFFGVLLIWVILRCLWLRRDTAVVSFNTWCAGQYTVDLINKNISRNVQTGYLHSSYMDDGE